jgi:hypothetical protein
MTTLTKDGNWDYAVGPLSADPDGDLNVYDLVWLCTTSPWDPTPPSEVIDRWDLSADDGDLNYELCPTGVVAPCPAFLPCCSWIPPIVVKK